MSNAFSAMATTLRDYKVTQKKVCRVNSKTGVTGVSICGALFRASVRHNGKTIHVGRYATVHEAQEAIERLYQNGGPL